MTLEKKKSNNVLVQGGILAASSLIVRMIGLLYRVPMTAILGDTAMGYYGSAFEFYEIALLLSSYSLPLAVSKLVSVREDQGQHANSRRVFMLALAFGAVVGGLATCVCYFGADLYGSFIHSPGVAIPLRVLAPTIFTFSVMGVIRGYFQGHNNMVPTAISQIVEQIINAAVSIIASYMLMRKYEGFSDQASYGAAGGTLGTFSGAFAALIFLVITYAIYRKAFNHLIEAEEAAGGHTPERNAHVLHLIIWTVIPVVVSQTIYQLSGTIDNIVFNRFLNAKGFEENVRVAWWGMYTGKYKLLTTVPVAIASAMGTAIVPSLIAEYVRGHLDSVRSKIATAVKFNMIIAFPCAAGMTVLARPILILLFGDGREISGNMLMYGSVCIVFFAFSTLTNGILQGVNRLNIPVRHSAIALAIHIATLVPLLKFTTLGVYALVICNIEFAFVVSVLNWISVSKVLSYKQEVMRTFISPLLASVCMGLAVRGFYQLLRNVCGVRVSCVLAIGFAVPVYFALLLLFRGVTKEELLKMPKGQLIVKILTKCRLLR